MSVTPHVICVTYQRLQQQSPESVRLSLYTGSQDQILCPVDSAATTSGLDNIAFTFTGIIVH